MKLSIKLFSYIIGIWLTTILQVSHAQICDIPADTSPPNEGILEILGGGYSEARQRIKPRSCIPGTPEKDSGSGMASLSAELLTNYKEITHTLNRSTNGKIKIGWFSFGGARSFVKKITEKSYSQTFVLKFTARTGNGRFVLDDTISLTEFAQQIKHDACEFKKYCGDSFIFQTEEGAELYVAIQLAFSSRSSFEQYQKSFSAGIEATLRVCCVDVAISASLGNAVNKITSSLKKQGEVNIFTYQKGGDVAQLGRLLGQNNAMANCSLENTKACLQMADNAVAYLASDAFINGVKESPAILSSATRPYWEVSPEIPDLPNEVTAEIENARKRLADAFDIRLTDQETLKNTFKLDLPGERRQQLEQLNTILDADIQEIYKAGLLCFSDLANCYKYSNKILMNLKSYDNSIINYNLADGLTAFYPFNNNILDESGNDYHGEIHEATITTDRFETLSAYYFNGSDSLIKINSNAINNNDIFSISYWIKTTDKSNNKHYFSAANNKNSNELLLKHSNGRVGVLMKNVGSEYTQNIINDGIWHNIIISRSGKNIKIYIDTKLELFWTNAPEGVLRVDNSGLWLGGDQDCIAGCWESHEYFKGSLDNIRIYNRLLTDAEIQQLYMIDAEKVKINQPPLAIFSASTLPGTQSIDLNATFSSDIDASTLLYQWHTSNGQTADGQTAQFNFQKSGEHLVTLTVTDDKGATSQAQKKVYVTTSDAIPMPPKPEPNNCKAQYSLDGRLYLPCVQVGVLGSLQILEVTLNQLKPNLKFNVNPLNFPQHNFRDACLATYNSSTGRLSLPCVAVQGVSREYAVELQQQSGTLSFTVTQLH